MDDKEIFDLALNYKNERSDKSNMDLYKLVIDNNNKQTSEIQSLRDEIGQLKALIVKLAAQK